jgi:TonB family protein
MLSYQSETSRVRLLRWSAAALLVVGLHAGGAAFALMMAPEDNTTDEIAGAVTFELAPEATVAQRDTPDLAPGPDATQGVITPPASKQEITKVDQELPPVPESPAPEPEVALPIPKPDQQQPEEEKPKESVQQEAAPSDATHSPVTTAPPKIEDAKTSTVTAAPRQGTSISTERLQASWQKMLSRHLNNHKRYPAEATRRGEKGVVNVKFVIDSTGQVQEASIEKSSGSKALDDEALAMLRRASPVPAPPDIFGGQMTSWVLPVQFNIK